MRLLPAIRLSIWDDSSTSPERQMERIQTYARLGDHELVPVSELDYDLDISGAVSPWERPGLGPWLKDDRLSMWEGIVVAKLDRLTRSLIDFVTLMSWLEARGKTLVCLDPQLDLTTPSGRAFAQILVTFAEYERETIAARVRDAWHKLRIDGQYAGGQVPFGYRPVKLARGWGYEPDPEYAPIVAEMCDRYVRYESLGSIARWLNESGVPTPWNASRLRNGKPLKDSMWATTTIKKILGSPAILGATVKTDGTQVKDTEGVVVYRADALVAREVWERVQARLRVNPATAKLNSWLLTGVASCAVCGAAMYSSGAKYNGKQYTYYCCVHSLRRDGKCTARRVKADELETVITEKLLELVGDIELTEAKLVSGRDYSKEMARMADQISHLSREVALGAVSGRDIRADQEALQRAHGELARLAALEPVEACVEPVRTGHTFAQRWEALDTSGRNEFLRSSEVRAYVESRSDNMPHVLTMPRPESDRAVILFGHGMRIVIDLGRLEKLREQARESSRITTTAY
jgi:site-specific DNA recombinase